LSDKDNVCEALNVTGPIPNALIDLLSLCNSNQFNSIRNVNNRSLDLFISNLDANLVQLSRSIDPLVIEDVHHPALQVDLRLSPIKFLIEERSPKTNFYGADYVKLSNELSAIDWCNELDDLDIDDAVNRFYAVLDPFIDSIPKTRCSMREYPNYYTRQLISLISKKARSKDKLKKLKKSTGVCIEELTEATEEFKRLRKQVKIDIEACFNNYVQNCEDKIKTNTKCFFAFTKSLRKTNSLPNNMKLNAEVGDDRQSICNLFAKFFSSVFNPAAGSFQLDAIYDPFYEAVDDIPPPEFSFTPAKIQDVLKGFNIHKVASPDNIPMMFFVKLSSSLGLPLSILFNKSLAVKKFPSKWKMSYVSPIFKDGNKSDISNYRPISILCAISKVFEKLVFNELFDQVKHRIHKSQHGFFSKRSTQSNLMEYVSMIAHEIVDGGQVDSVYTDFSKAFDKVNHHLLIRKLMGFGLNDNVVLWLSSYLRDRSQFVVIGNSRSNRIDSTSGVPQGSIIGPLLFIIFINDLLSSLSSRLYRLGK